MRIDGLRSEVAAIGVGPERGGAAGGFEGALGDAVRALEHTQREADAAATKVALGEGSLHEASLALEKADVAMRVAVRVRNKAVEAYQELMRMQV